MQRMHIFLQAARVTRSESGGECGRTEQWHAVLSTALSATARVENSLFKVLQYFRPPKFSSSQIHISPLRSYNRSDHSYSVFSSSQIHISPLRSYNKSDHSNSVFSSSQIHISPLRSYNKSDHLNSVFSISQILISLLRSYTKSDHLSSAFSSSQIQISASMLNTVHCYKQQPCPGPHGLAVSNPVQNI